MPEIYFTGHRSSIPSYWEQGAALGRVSRGVAFVARGERQVWLWWRRPTSRNGGEKWGTSLVQLLYWGVFSNSAEMLTTPPVTFNLRSQFL